MKREDIKKAAAIYTAQAEDSDYAEVRDVKQAFVFWNGLRRKAINYDTKKGNRYF